MRGLARKNTHINMWLVRLRHTCTHTQQTHKDTHTHNVLGGHAVRAPLGGIDLDGQGEGLFEAIGHERRRGVLTLHVGLRGEPGLVAKHCDHVVRHDGGRGPGRETPDHRCAAPCSVCCEEGVEEVLGRDLRVASARGLGGCRGEEGGGVGGEAGGEVGGELHVGGGCDGDAQEKILINLKTY